MVKLYPSSIAEVVGQTTNGYKEACPRFFINKDLAPRVNIPVLYSVIGAMEEQRYESTISNQTFEREVPVKQDFEGGFMLSGRADIVWRDSAGNITKIHECKATVSRAIYSRSIKNGEIEYRHLAQLITYMSVLKVEEGSLSVSYYHFNRDCNQIAIESRTFEILLDNTTGIILVDGSAYKYSAQEILRFYKILMEAVINPEVPPRTLNQWACGSCPFREACEKSPNTKEEFRRYIKHSSGETIVSTFSPKLNVHNIRGVKS